jgi:putative transposase
MHDEWQAGDRHYLSETSMARLYPDRDNAIVAAIGGDT